MVAPNPSTFTNTRIPQSEFLDPLTKRPAREWLFWMQNPDFVSASLNIGLSPKSGGTGTTQVPENGQLLIGNGTTQAYTVNDLSVGLGIGKTVGPGFLSIENTGVLSFSAGTTGFTPNEESTGDIVLDGILGVANGGTGQSSYTDGQLLIGNSTGNTLNKSTLTAGTGITITNGPGSITIESTGGLTDQENQTATSGQTVFTLTTMTYAPGSNSLSVFIDGVNQQLGTAFTETNSTTVTFTSGLHVGAKVRFATA